MIELDDVFVLYRGEGRDVVALRGLSLTVAAGECVVVNGPSGSGKSTLVRVLTGEVLPGAGRARVVGDTGVVTQGSGRDLAPELTCLENVVLAARLARRDRSGAAADDARAALDRFGVGALAARYPATLSNGEAQRVGIAAALVCTPSVIIADEPTGELDRGNADLVYRLLAEQASRTGAALLLVTHDRGADVIADRVVTIRDGRVSDERIGGTERLIVDERGWLRLPAAARDAAGVVGRAVWGVDGAAIRLSRPAADAVAPVRVEAVARRTDPARHRVVVRADAVSCTLDGTQVLAPVSLAAGHGLCALVGPSGSGKTTLLGLLGGLGAPTAGVIERAVGVRTAVATSLAGFAEHLDVRANLELARRVRGDEGLRAAVAVDRPAPDAAAVGSATDQAALLGALGIAHLGHRAVGSLSGGERQRVGIARALCSDAELVLLDEPTSQLDEASASRVAHALQRAASARTVVCTTHDEALIAVADTVHALGTASVVSSPAF